MHVHVHTHFTARSSDSSEPCFRRTPWMSCCKILHCRPCVDQGSVSQAVTHSPPTPLIPRPSHGAPHDPQLVGQLCEHGMTCCHRRGTQPAPRALPGPKTDDRRTLETRMTSTPTRSPNRGNLPELPRRRGQVPHGTIGITEASSLLARWGVLSRSPGHHCHGAEHQPGFSICHGAWVRSRDGLPAVLSV